MLYVKLIFISVSMHIYIFNATYTSIHGIPFQHVYLYILSRHQQKPVVTHYILVL